MPKQNSTRRKKRSFHGNRYLKVHDNETVVRVEEDETGEVRDDEGEELDLDNTLRPAHPDANALNSPASVRKLSHLQDDSSESTCDSDESNFSNPSGYRLIDMDLLSNAIQMMICPHCKSSHVKLQENKNGKMGFASEFAVVCSEVRCQFQHQFYSSKKTGRAFEINRRSVLGARNTSVGRQGLVKFSAVMDMPPPMNSNAYTDTVKVIANAAEEVAQASMAKAASETKEYYKENENDGTYQIEFLAMERGGKGVGVQFQFWREIEMASACCLLF